MAKKTKYDTNPLDPDFPRRTQEQQGRGAPTDEVAPGAEEQTRTLETEAPTRRIEAPYSAPTSYPSVFVPPKHEPPAAVPFAPPVTTQQPTSRNIPGLNLPENVVMLVPYIPFYLGAIAGAVTLLFVPRQETRIRFHAAQGLALHLAVIAIQFLFNIFNNFTAVRIGEKLFFLASIALFIVSMIRVWKGEPHHIAPLDEVTGWLNEKIEPRN